MIDDGGGYTSLGAGKIITKPDSLVRQKRLGWLPFACVHVCPSAPLTAVRRGKRALQFSFDKHVEPSQYGLVDKRDPS
jgi:hypothetical protein